MENNKKYSFHVKGMHCPACVVFIEEELRELEGVTSVHASLSKREVFLEGNFSENPEKLLEKLNPKIAEGGYSLSVEKLHGPRWGEFIYALPISLFLVFVFLLLQKIGFANFIGGEKLTYSTALFVGVVASLSTCLAVVGGLVLSISSSYAKNGRAWLPQTMFHIGRMLGFFVLGGLIAVLGQSLPWTATNGFILTILVSLVMFALGLNLLDTFAFARKLQFRLPKNFARGILGVQEKFSSHILPFVLGALTFFLPCGFTQSMQIAALASGDFWTGALIMFFFALGTLPVLAILSFSGLTLHNKKWTGVFFKTAGILVMLLSLWNILSALQGVGIIPFIITF
jgi:sulfite exporter TauE/SafE/copper chaperone CopZ